MNNNKVLLVLLSVKKLYSFWCTFHGGTFYPFLRHHALIRSKVNCTSVLSAKGLYFLVSHKVKRARYHHSK